MVTGQREDWKIRKGNFEPAEYGTEQLIRNQWMANEEEQGIQGVTFLGNKTIPVLGPVSGLKIIELRLTC